MCLNIKFILLFTFLFKDFKYSNKSGTSTIIFDKTEAEKLRQKAIVYIDKVKRILREK
ncbi:hypothetical protein GF386_00730 [Candidatus Pacearchaeota archaeon]|nr:hypothetical protein [Candidatus Pacearchaeota archaeon]MBD3282783.1 hypothetical protein [Candidatus Pacearchaeota archaeon]